MELIEFTLKAGNRLLLDKVNIQFDKHVKVNVFSDYTNR